VRQVGTLRGGHAHGNRRAVVTMETAGKEALGANGSDARMLACANQRKCKQESLPPRNS
jgi:hypothetical protein